MNFVLKIDTGAAVIFTNKLEQMRKFDLPIAIRSALNSAAFDVKQKTMPVSARKHFVNRKPNFFKANSKVQMATGFAVDSMRSSVGFISSNLQYNNFAVRELEQQEYGGLIPKRSFVPLDTSRRDDTNATPVRPANRLSNIKKIVDVRNAKGRSMKQRFIKSAIHAGVGGFVKAGISKEILYRITSIKRVGIDMLIKKVPIYSYEEGRKADVGTTGFMREATVISANKLESFYIEEANKRIAKLAGSK